MTYRATIAFVLAAELLAVPITFAAQSVLEASDGRSTPELVESAVETRQRAPFDLALVGLTGFPDPLETQGDFSRAAELIDARIAELTESHRADRQADTDTGESNAEASGKGDDPRIAPLRSLRLAVQ
jgi:hypothetical protein